MTTKSTTRDRSSQINYLPKPKSLANNWSARNWQITIFCDITEFNNCFIIHQVCFSYLNHYPSAQKRNRLFLTTHEREIICSKTHLDGTTHEQTIICRSRGGLLANEKEEKMHRMIICFLSASSYTRIMYQKWWRLIRSHLKQYKLISFFLFLQFFTHPVVDTEMKRKWFGRDFMKTEWKRWKTLFVFWCLFDLVFSPVLFAVFSLMTKNNEGNPSWGRKLRIGSGQGYNGM